MIDFKSYASGSKGNLYTVDDGRTKVLLEMGLPIREINKALNFRLPSFALLTHAHKDHSRAVKEIMRAGIDVYASQGTIDALSLSGHRIHAVRVGEQFSVGSWLVMPVEAKHDAPEPLAFLMASSERERFLFATDTCYLKNRFNNLNVIAVECNYALDILRQNVANGSLDAGTKNRIVKSHFSLDTVKGFLKANNLSLIQEIWLLHLSDGNSDAELFKREIQQLTGKPTYIY